jgi:TusA-related sulfurtransferase
MTEAITVQYLICPLPVLKVQKHLSKLPSGACLRVEHVNDETLEELELFNAEKPRFKIQDKKKEGGLYHLLLQKA